MPSSGLWRTITQAECTVRFQFLSIFPDVLVTVSLFMALLLGNVALV